MFAEAKPLGSEGLNWLKLHAINLTGLKKRDPVDERLKYAEEILPLMLQSADTPLEEEGKWWMESDDPWQTLGVCMEIRDAIRSGDPPSYMSRLPLHQDGSCNGLQHYAALGRDVLGARSVNLLPAEAPQDVYSEIAAIVERKRRADAERGANEADIALALDGFVQRKVIKQTVMTTVYGVTKYGAKLQIAKQLKDKEEFPVERVEEASKYLADKTFESLNEMFTASQKIQAWLTECAKIISGDLRQMVSWTTPLGLRVSQPYSKTRHRKPQRETDDLCGAVDRTLGELYPNTLKQRNGFPPNFVHSLDSSHMMLTSLHMWSAGLTYASVHDCFWTHACSVEAMNRICREQFVALHSHEVLEELADSFRRDLADKEVENPVLRARAAQLFAALPSKGQLDLNKVKESVYFFS